MSTRTLTMAAAISEALAQAMAADERIFVMGEDVGRYGGIFGATGGLFERFGPTRVIDTPISETAFIGAALGAAAEGRRPVVELMFADFFGVCFDQIYNHLAKNRYMSGGAVGLPVVLQTAIGGGYNDAAQHSQCLYASFAHVPGLKVVVPSDAHDAKGLMTEALAGEDPVVFMYHKGLMGLPWMSFFEGASVPVPEAPYRLPFGRARTVRPGRDLTLVTLGQMVHKARLAAAALAADGIEAEVLDLRTLVPLDRHAVIESVARTGRLLVADEDYLSYGLSGEILAVVGEALGDGPGRVRLRAPMRRIAVPDVPIPYSRPLEQAAIPQVADLVAAARALLAADFEGSAVHV